MADSPAQEIRLRGVPARLFIESQNHQQGLIRELTLMDLGDRSEPPRIERSQRVAALIRDILHHFADVRSVTRQQAIAALERGEDEVDLILPRSDELVPALRRWLALVEEADAVCGEGTLLTMAASEPVRQLRRWYVAAIARSAQTGAPQRWPAAQHTGR